MLPSLLPFFIFWLFYFFHVLLYQNLRDLQGHMLLRYSFPSIKLQQRTTFGHNRQTLNQLGFVFSAAHHSQDDSADWDLYFQSRSGKASGCWWACRCLAQKKTIQLND